MLASMAVQQATTTKTAARKASKKKAQARAPQRKDGARSRAALVRAGIVCVAKRGVVAVKVKDVVDAARASPSSFYHFYSDLPALFADVLIDIFARLFAALREAVDAAVADSAVDDAGAARVVRAIVSAHVDWVLAHRSDAFTMYQLTAVELAPAHAARVVAAKAPLYAPLASAIAPFMAAGLVPPWSVLEFDVLVMGPAHEALRRALSGAPLDESFLRATLPDAAVRITQGAFSVPNNMRTNGPPRGAP